MPQDGCVWRLLLLWMCPYLWRLNLSIRPSRKLCRWMIWGLFMGRKVDWISCAHMCVCGSFCVCECESGLCVCFVRVYALRIVSADNILCFMNPLFIISYVFWPGSCSCQFPRHVVLPKHVLLLRCALLTNSCPVLCVCWPASCSPLLPEHLEERGAGERGGAREQRATGHLSGGPQGQGQGQGGLCAGDLPGGLPAAHGQSLILCQHS